ncbi:motility associated factor glycosyltransferase family protein [Priestia koreensis]|uniref:motility associated factor glycosyltransferase family protein n=1 Tax=Priestia koreensis TaxID=284581 RepID=UPI001F59003C|nr:6-hydroxymethylpterin diphosphokinase MptE-like protein [Priestia koreensis]UNL84782.1 motility associated factor glycosyltransferase family protein [Priestia koreensis]
MLLDEQQALKEEILTQCNIELNSNKEMVLQLNGFYTSSKYNPIKEAQRIAESNYKKHYCHIVIGIGTGYIIEEFYNKMCDHEHLVVIELNKEVLDQVVKHREMNFLYEDARVSVIDQLNIEEFTELMESYASSFKNRIQVIVNPNYGNIYPLNTSKILEVIKRSLLLQVVNKNTMEFFSHDWQKNYTANLYNAFDAIPFSRLDKSLSCPIVLVSGGPSLNKQIHFLKELQERAFILCAGTTINTLLKHGIEPNAVVTIDGGEVNFQHFEGININSIPLLYSMKVHHAIPNQHQGIQIVFNVLGENLVNELTDRIVNRDIGSVFPGFSVANSALDVAFQLTSGPIALIGQDLAYTNNQSHAEGNKNQRVIDEKYIKERRMFEVEGYYGDMVLTDSPLNGMNRSFVHYLNYIKPENRINRIFNCTEGGAMIRGMENMPFERFIDKYCELNVPFEELNKLKTLKQERNKEEWMQFYKILEAENSKNDKLIEITMKAKEVIAKMHENELRWTTDIISKLEHIDRELKETLETEFLYFLYQPIIYAINNSYLEEDNETQNQIEKRIYLKSKALYEGLYTCSLYAKEWLDLLLSKISFKIKGESD